MLSLYAIKSRHRATAVRTGGYGHVSVVRWEYGVGKGRWKRRLNAIAEKHGATGRIRARYFLIGSRYAGRIEGTGRFVDEVWEAL